MRKPITEFEIVDHGIENSSYFQGCGLAFTEFDDIATGIGSNPAEAIDDVLEALAQNDWECEGMEERICEDYKLKSLPVSPNTDKFQVEDEDSEMYYFISIRVK